MRYSRIGFINSTFGTVQLHLLYLFPFFKCIHNGVLLILSLYLHAGYRYVCYSAVAFAYQFFLTIFTPRAVSLQYKRQSEEEARKGMTLMRRYSLSRGFRPQPPPGFRIRLTDTGEGTLNSLHVYRLAISYMNSISWTSWHAQCIATGQQWTRDTASLFVADLANPSHTLENGLVLLGLYDGLVKMSESAHFQSSLIEIFIHDQPIGKILISTSTVVSSPSSNKTLTANSGRWVDPHLGRITLNFNWRPPRITVDDIFTALMQAILIVSYGGTNQPFDFLNAASASGRCALNIRKPGPVHLPSSTPALTVATLCTVLTDFVIEQNRFEGLDFSMEIYRFGQQVKPLEGFIRALGPPPSSHVATR